MSQLDFANNETGDILNHFSSQPAEGRPKKCCACNGKTGACKNCSCVKNKQKCTSCAPLFHKRCTNAEIKLSCSQPTVPQVPSAKRNCDYNFSTSNYFTKAKVSCCKFIPKACRSDAANCFLEITDVIAKNSCDVSSWSKLLLLPHHCFKTPTRGGIKNNSAKFMQRNI